MTQELWSAREALMATRGRLEGADGFSASGVTFDSREVAPGDLFLALKGARDGHDFVQTAFDAGAAAAVVERPCAGGPCLIVDDVQKALESLAAQARDRAPQVRRGAVTGSVGKTSVTQAVLAGLKRAGRAHGSVKSFNNHIGAPLTLARMPADAERAVFELGMNHADEIRPLTRLVQPHVVCITNVGPVHVENFPDGEIGVARAKAEIFEGLPAGGLAVIGSGNPWFDLLKSQALHAGARIATFGAETHADARLLDYQGDEYGGRIEARLWGHDYVYRLKTPGYHWALNSLCILLMLEGLDVDIETALAAIEAFEPLQGRGKAQEVLLPESLGGGAFTLIDESYNANPLSMRAAFANLGNWALGEEGRRMVVLTDMLELGEQSPRLHAQLAELAVQAKVDRVYAAGPLMKFTYDALPDALKAAYAPDADALAPLIEAAPRSGDVVMVKGSNGSRAGALAKALAGLNVTESGDV